MPKPYYTGGHPDEQDLAEAFDFGREMVENSPRIAAGETNLVYPDPEMNDKVFEQAMICSNMLLCPTNPQGAFYRIPEKCHYPQCHICMDNCMMDTSICPRIRPGLATGDFSVMIAMNVPTVLCFARSVQ